MFIPPCLWFLKLFQPVKVHLLLKWLKKKRSHGYDEISAKLLKTSAAYVHH